MTTASRSSVPIVFLSSTSEDLRPYRAAARDAAVAVEFLPKMMEYFEARGDHPPLSVCLEKVGAADLVVAIAAYRYGWVPPDQAAGDARSITWLECESAVQAGKEVLAFVVDEEQPWPVELREEYRATEMLLKGRALTPQAFEDIQRNIERLHDFKAWLKGRGVSATFTTADDLQYKIAQALRGWRDRHPEFSRALPPAPRVEVERPDLYLRWLLARTAFIDIRGLQAGSGKAHRFAIEDLWISLTAIAPAPGRPVGKNAVSQSTGTDVRSSPLHEALRERRLVVLGDPGSGKSTFLNRVASALCRTILGDAPQAAALLGFMEAPFPLLVKVADLIEHIGASRTGATDRRPTTLDSPDWLIHYLATASTASQCVLSSRFLQERLNIGPCLLLVDGLDEAPDRQTRESVVRLIENAGHAFRGASIVVTSRPGAYVDRAILPQFAHARIDPLDDGQMDTFLDRWCAALYEGSPADAARHRGELVWALRARPDIRAMARTPVMLTALAVVHWNERRLPEQRADLYESVITWLARSREHRSDRPVAERAVALLGELALAMQMQEKGRVVQIARREAAEAIAGEWSHETKAGRRIELAERFLEDEELDSGIVVRRGQDVRFRHLTFQEFLAARAVAGRPDTEQWRLLAKDDRLYQAEWREVVLLLSGLLCRQGRAKVEALIGAALKAVPSTSPLAEQARCAGLVGRIARDLAPFGYEPADPRYRELLGEVLGLFDPARAARVPLETRIEAAEALGRGGDPRLDEDREDRYVQVPAGSFKMGAQRENRRAANFDPAANADEGPVHDVELDAYLIGRYPVTVVEYERFMASEGYLDPRWWKAGGFERWPGPKAWDQQRDYPNWPVTGVTWFEAAAYAAWAGGRLPTEAEWERAARSADGRRFPWGDQQPEPSRMNYAGTRPRAGPTPVGIYPEGAGPHGIQDMAGNVWEWCQDWFHSRYYEGSPRTDPQGPGGGKRRVQRGGSWASLPEHCRSAFRISGSPDVSEPSCGFRVVIGRPVL
jgi:formylglycine-generating enzyme required for sulfatase activity